MEYREAKNELKNYTKLKKRLERLTDRECELTEKINSAGGQKITGLPSAHSKIHDLSDYVVALEKIRVNKEKAQIEVSKIETRVAVMQDDELGEIIRLRYLKERCWSEVGNKFDRSESWAKNKNKEAIRAYAACQS